MKALSLFSGIGGIDLACEWADIETVAFCEREPFCQKVLHKHWPQVPIYDDVCTLTKERLEADGIGTIELIHGGYPCQPFSHAGQRKGAGDDRHLWPEVKRLLEEVRPRWFVGENVAGHVTLGLDEVLADLDDIGYTQQPFVIPAVAVNAPHRRDRVFIVAHTPFYGRNPWRTEPKGQQRELRIVCGSTQTALISDTKGERCGEEREYQSQRPAEWTAGSSKTIPDSNIKRREEFNFATSSEGMGVDTWGTPSGRVQWAAEPDVGRVANGIPNRVDRLKALGNAVVPQQIYPILAAIKQIDDMMRLGA